MNVMAVLPSFTEGHFSPLNPNHFKRSGQGLPPRGPTRGVGDSWIPVGNLHAHLDLPTPTEPVHQASPFFTSGKQGRRDATIQLPVGGKKPLNVVAYWLPLQHLKGS